MKRPDHLLSLLIYNEHYWQNQNGKKKCLWGHLHFTTKQETFIFWQFITYLYRADDEAHTYVHSHNISISSFGWYEPTRYRYLLLKRLVSLASFEIKSKRNVEQTRLEKRFEMKMRMLLGALCSPTKMPSYLAPSLPLCYLLYFLQKNMILASLQMYCSICEKDWILSLIDIYNGRIGRCEREEGNLPMKIGSKEHQIFTV